MGRGKDKHERKRGKKKRGGERESAAATQESAPLHTQDFISLHQGEKERELSEERAGPSHDTRAGPAWMIDHRPAQSSETSAPFGLVEPDLKAYLRSAHLRLQELVTAVVDEGRQLDQDEETKTLRNAMLDEIKGKELILATDGDTSLILEDLLCTFGERQTRILGDALSKELKVVAVHRFGSHLLQSTLSTLQTFASKEQLSAGTAASSSSSTVAAQDGHILQSASEMIIDMSRALRNDAGELLEQQFASHVLRSLILVLAARPARASSLRSKKSRKFHASNKFAELVHSHEATQPVLFPPFTVELNELLEAIKSNLADDARIRSICVDPIISPTLALVLELDAAKSKGKGAKTILHACLDGAPDAQGERSAHVETLLRDSVGSHLLQVVVAAFEPMEYDAFWIQYIRGRVAKLGAHPIANFIIAAALARASTQQSQEACADLAENGDGIVKHHCIGVLTALIDRCGLLMTQIRPAKEEFWTSASVDCLAVRTVMRLFGYDREHDGEEHGLLLRALLSGKTRKEIKKLEKLSKKKKSDKPKYKARKRKHGDEDGKHSATPLPQHPFLVKPTIQGSLLCQSIARLHHTAHQPLLSSLMGVGKLSKVATDSVAVHVILAFLRSPHLTFQQRSSLSMAALAELEDLLNDKFGSRVIDDSFDYSDLFFKAKMAKACVEGERRLLASLYGRFFLKRIQLALYRRDVDEWKSTIKAQAQARREAEVDQARRDVEKCSKQLENGETLGGDPVVPAQKKQKKRSKIDQDLDAILAAV